MKATNNVTAKLAKRMDWALMTPVGTFKMGVSGSIPPNEVFCCNIRTSKMFVRSAGFGWSAGMSWTMNAAATAENKPA
jgi:hypothetical protein